MKKELQLDIPDFKLFDFHRHISDIKLFEQNLKEFNIDNFCLMPSMIENDFGDITKVQDFQMEKRKGLLKQGIVQK